MQVWSRTASGEGRVTLPMIIGVAFVAFLMTGFYLSYAHTAWFFQDDFGFIEHYAAEVRLPQLWDFTNFGRFVTRNVYWHYGQQLFALDAQYYYLFNLFCIGVTSVLAGLIVSRGHDRFAGVVAGLFYYALPATAAAYVWLSNSQHLIGHLFVVLFVYLFVSRAPSADGRTRFGTILALLIVLTLGYMSNIFMCMAVSLPIWMLVADPRHRRDWRNYVVPLAGIVLFVIFYLKLKAQQSGAYGTSYRPSVFWENAAYYFYGNASRVVWTIAVVAGAALSWAKGRLFTAWLFLASLAFFLPFAFLLHQRYEQYGVLAQLFFLMAALCALHESLPARRVNLARWIGVAALLFICGAAFRGPIAYFSREPYGAGVRADIETLRNFDRAHPEVSVYCFRPSQATVNTSGVKTWDIPAEWWFSGFGMAYTVFVNHGKTFRLASGPEAPRCDVTFMLENGHVGIPAN
ncbi:hypothetical protein QCE63_23270 [Caballeronia sp. LZ065]|uniref:hypothetical protein n=1 Tax=Caballeronia sp. LZ065 TaxID=3038571 RepID=UPI00285A21CA|nr:hypothetical protein [Caballeronia sp. LZ065]MDR5782328.1 hypothetical protein [Caballeronia sp. LZ065]